MVVVERVCMYLAAEDQTPRKLKRLSGLEDEDTTYSNPNTSSKLNVHITGRRPFIYLGVDYPDRPAHAFQAQKFSDEDDRERIATLGLMEAVSEGRRADIDVAEWDANKAKLMYSLLKEQDQAARGDGEHAHRVARHQHPRGRRLRRVLTVHAAQDVRQAGREARRERKRSQERRRRTKAQGRRLARQKAGKARKTE